MSSFTVVNPPALGAPRGYSHGLLAPKDARLLFVAGQTAADPAGTVVSLGLADQFDAALGKVLAVVAAAGGAPEHIGSMTIFVTDLEQYLAQRSALSGTWVRHMGTHYPAIALVEVTKLVEGRAVVEIQATAAIP